jgi:hypothetical protein
LPESSAGTELALCIGIWHRDIHKYFSDSIYSQAHKISNNCSIDSDIDSDLQAANKNGLPFLEIYFGISL